MKKNIIFFCFLLSFICNVYPKNFRRDYRKKDENIKTYVTSQIMGRLGNNLFQVATACALAWDYGAEPSFPELLHKIAYSTHVRKHILFRCNVRLPRNRIINEWHDPSFTYDKIEYRPNIKIFGYFQSEKYFYHHRDRILELFAPNSTDMNYIKNKYSHILNHPNSVGVQIRDYYEDDKTGSMYFQYGIDYLTKTMAYFPENTLFVVSSNNREFAKKNIPSFAKNIIFLNEPFYIDFYILSLCKHNIITNSTFGWWAAWLNKNPNKIVFCPKDWVGGLCCDDVCPDRWIKIDAKHGCSDIIGSY